MVSTSSFLHACQMAWGCPLGVYEYALTKYDLSRPNLSFLVGLSSLLMESAIVNLLPINYGHVESHFPDQSRIVR